MALTALQILQRDKENAARYAERAGKTRARRLLERAQLELNQRLARAEGLKGPGPDSFTAAQMRAALAQVRAVLAPLQHGLLQSAQEIGKESAEQGAGDAVDYIQRAEQEYRGSARPIPFDTASMVDEAVRGSDASVLRRLAGDPAHPAQPGVLQRYGTGTIGLFEQAMQQRLIQGKSWDEARQDLVDASPFLQGKPAFWSERILRTESMFQHNAAGQQTLEQVHDAVGGMLKVLCATFDARTGSDSIAVHGQVRRVSEAFQSWFGPYMHPPNRPNDREVVVPHNVAWALPDSLKPRSDGDVAARWQLEGRTGSPPPRPLMSTVDLVAEQSQASLPPMADAPAVGPTAPPEPEAAPAPVEPVPLPPEPRRAYSIPRAPERPVLDAQLQRELAAAVAPLVSPLVEHSKISKLGGGANESKKLTWADEAGRHAQGVWKPAAGEELRLRHNIRAGTYHKREAAAYALDRMMGGETVVPPTISRTLQGEPGSLQRFQPGAKVAQKVHAKGGTEALPLEDPSVRRMQLLDLISGNTDRHNGNWLVDKRGRAVAIDNGLAFPEGDPERFLVPGYSYDVNRQSKLLDIDPAQRALLSKLQPEAVGRMLFDHGLGPEAVRTTLGRLQSLQQEPDFMSRERDAQRLEGTFASSSTRAIAEDWAQGGWQRTLSQEQRADLASLVDRIKPPE